MKKVIKIFVLISVVAIMILTLCVSSFASNIFGEVCGECGSDNLRLRRMPSDEFCGEVYCKDCDYYCFDPQHEFVEGVCSYCSYVCDHSYGSWEIETEAECEVEGYQVRRCSTCGDSIYEVIPALGHKYVNNVCSVCGDDKTDETTKAPDETTSVSVKDHEHNWSSWQKVDENKHSRSCQDSDCSAKETKSHEDKDTDGKCDICDGMYLKEVPIEKILGAVLGVALVLGVIYMVSLFTKKE